MGVMNEKATLKVEVDFGETPPEARADMMNRLARLYEQPGRKLVLTLEFGDADDLMDARGDISAALRFRDAGIGVKYGITMKDVDVIEQDQPATPMERRLGVDLQGRPARTA